ncbi:hypothetical protein J3R82DRAFT_1399 [Butyriboletus roseoflavus]|nr:hypothetical protein J3R82DRAFT_1399 [Butyriboletus roseoflavus]
MGGGLGRVTNHPDYYLSDGSVSFLAGRTLFRVHKSFFERESEVFRNLFASAAKDDPEAGTDESPFALDVSPDEFEKLLWVWYDRDYSYRHQTKDNWVVILRLATRWEFSRIRELAVRELDALELPPAERISIYNEHGIDGERLLSPYVELCRSPTLPSEAEGHLMQMETLIQVLQAREDAHRKAVELGHESPTSASLEDDALKEIVSKHLEGSNPRSNGTSTGPGGQAPDLHGELAYRTTANRCTITLGEPQVPDRIPKSTSKPPLHPYNLQASRGKENREKEQGKGAESKKAGEGSEDKRKEPAEVGAAGTQTITELFWQQILGQLTSVPLAHFVPFWTLDIVYLLIACIVFIAVVLFV